jgi:hypothetical protein
MRRPASVKERSRPAGGDIQRQLAEDAVNAYIFNPAQVAVSKKGLKGCGPVRRSSPTTGRGVAGTVSRDG